MISNLESQRKVNQTIVTPYETVFVVHPDHSAKVKELAERFKKIIEGLDGSVFHTEEWGLRELSYRIKKQSKGYYFLFRYRSSARAVEELERNMKLSDAVLRYLTVRLDEEEETHPAPKSSSQETGKGGENLGGAESPS